VSTHSDSINPMSSFLKFAGISIASIIILILLNNMLFKDEVKEESAKIADKETVVDLKQIAENIKPIGQVTLTAVANTGTAQVPRSAEEIYKTTCSVCHLTGVANAPKIDDKVAWEPRIAAGLAALITNATNGKGAMPPRGGKADLSDDELKATILYMTNLAGFELSESAGENAAVPSSTPSEDPAAATLEVLSAPVVAPEASAPTSAITMPEVPSTPAPVTIPEAPSAAPIVIPEAATPVPEAAISPEAAALGYVLIPPIQPIPSIQPVAPQFPQPIVPMI